MEKENPLVERATLAAKGGSLRKRNKKKINMKISMNISKTNEQERYRLFILFIL